MTVFSAHQIQENSLSRKCMGWHFMTFFFLHLRLPTLFSTLRFILRHASREIISTTFSTWSLIFLGFWDQISENVSWTWLTVCQVWILWVRRRTSCHLGVSSFSRSSRPKLCPPTPVLTPHFGWSRSNIFTGVCRQNDSDNMGNYTPTTNYNHARMNCSLHEIVSVDQTPENNCSSM